jgi:hypothetical protein
MSSIKNLSCVILMFGASQLAMAQGAKKTTAKPEAKTETAANLVVSLADAFSGATNKDFAANGKVLRGVFNIGDKFQIITADNKIMECVVKEMQVVSNNLKVKQAGKDAELFITFSVEKPDVECSNACIAAAGTISSYADFQKIKQDYKPTPVVKKSNGGNDNIYQLNAK